MLEKIETEFNSESGEVCRDRLILRKKYENLKKRTKKRFADEKCHVLGTGGGPGKRISELTDIDIEIKEILGERISGLQSEFDADAEIITIINESANNSFGDLTNRSYENLENDSSMLSKEKTSDMLPEEEATDETEDVNSKYHKENLFQDGQLQLDWFKNSAQNLKTPISKSLTLGDGSKNNKRKRNDYEALCSKVSQWAASKANLESEKIRFAEEEHHCKVQLMQRKFEIEHELMKKESEAKIRKLEREMEVKVEGIIEQNKLKREILLMEKHVIMQKLK